MRNGQLGAKPGVRPISLNSLIEAFPEPLQQGKPLRWHWGGFWTCWGGHSHTSVTFAFRLSFSPNLPERGGCWAGGSALIISTLLSWAQASLSTNSSWVPVNGCSHSGSVLPAGNSDLRGLGAGREGRIYLGFLYKSQLFQTKLMEKSVPCLSYSLMTCKPGATIRKSLYYARKWN